MNTWADRGTPSMVDTSFDRSFSHLSIRTRTFGGFGVLLILLILLGTTSYSEMHDIATEMTRTAALSNANDAVGEVDQKVGALSTATEVFLQSRQSADIAVAHELAAGLQRSIDGLDAKLTGIAADAADMQGLKQAAASQVQAMAGIIASIDAERTAIERLGSTGTLAATVADALVLHADQFTDPAARVTPIRAQSALQGSRVAMTRFMLVHQPVGLDNLSQELVRLKLAMQYLRTPSGSARLNPLLEALPGRVATFVATTGAGVAAADVRAHAERGLADASRKLRTALDAATGRFVMLRDTALHQQDTLITQLRSVLLTVSSGAVLVGLVLAWLITRSVTRPITGMTVAMQRLAGGELAVSMPGAGHHDEIGRMAKAVEVFRDQARQVVATEAAKQEAERRAAETRRQETGAFADAFQASVMAVSAAVSEAAQRVQTVSSGLTQTAEDTSKQAETVTNAATQATHNVNTVAAATEELAASIVEISGQANGATSLVQSAVTQATGTDATLRELQAAAEKIGAVVELIQGIAG